MKISKFTGGEGPHVKIFNILYSFLTKFEVLMLEVWNEERNFGDHPGTGSIAHLLTTSCLILVIQFL